MRMEHRVRSRVASNLELLIDESQVQTAREISPRAARDLALDINTAQPLRLRSLSGIGKYYAEKILEGRPYRDREDLLVRHILPPHIYARIMERLCVGSH